MLNSEVKISGVMFVAQDFPRKVQCQGLNEEMQSDKILPPR